MEVHIPFISSTARVTAPWKAAIPAAMSLLTPSHAPYFTAREVPHFFFVGIQTAKCISQPQLELGAQLLHRNLFDVSCP